MNWKYLLAGIISTIAGVFFIKLTRKKFKDDLSRENAIPFFVYLNEFLWGPSALAYSIFFIGIAMTLHGVFGLW